jgi:hypothetical protein
MVKSWPSTNSINSLLLGVKNQLKMDFLFSFKAETSFDIKTMFHSFLINFKLKYNLIVNQLNWLFEEFQVFTFNYFILSNLEKLYESWTIDEVLFYLYCFLGVYLYYKQRFIWKEKLKIILLFIILIIIFIISA